MSEKRVVKMGVGELPERMTYKQALRYGNLRMPRDMKKVGFETMVFVSDPEIDGSKFYRINYALRCKI